MPLLAYILCWIYKAEPCGSETNQLRSGENGSGANGQEEAQSGGEGESSGRHCCRVLEKEV